MVVVVMMVSVVLVVVASASPCVCARVIAVIVSPLPRWLCQECYAVSGVAVKERDGRGESDVSRALVA